METELETDTTLKNLSHSYVHKKREWRTNEVIWTSSFHRFLRKIHRKSFDDISTRKRAGFGKNENFTYGTDVTNHYLVISRGKWVVFLSSKYNMLVNQAAAHNGGFWNSIVFNGLKRTNIRSWTSLLICSLSYTNCTSCKIYNQGAIQHRLKYVAFIQKYKATQTLWMTWLQIPGRINIL